MKAKNYPVRWLCTGIFGLFILGSLLHFTYEWSGGSPIVATFSAVNESVWEHTKLVVLPIALWWSSYYFMFQTNYGLNGDRWFSGCLVSLVVAIITIPTLVYTMKYGLNISNMPVHLLIFLISCGCGQFVGIHVYNKSRGINKYLCWVLILLIFTIFALLTFFTPLLPIFMDPVNGRYGIA